MISNASHRACINIEVNVMHFNLNLRFSSQQNIKIKLGKKTQI
jgi:hypothetical protein